MTFCLLQRFDGVNQRLDEFSGRMGRLEERFDRTDERFERISSHFYALYRLLNRVGAGIIGTLVAGILTLIGVAVF